MKQCKTCIHEPVCEKAKHVENYRIGECEDYKYEGDFSDFFKNATKIEPLPEMPKPNDVSGMFKNVTKLDSLPKPPKVGD